MIGTIGRAVISRFDVLLRRVYHVREFTLDESCILRIALARSPGEITLSDGTRIGKGEVVGELHLWNEHIPPMDEEGPSLEWALKSRRLLRASLKKLATYLEDEPQFESVRAFRGETAFPKEGLEGRALFERLGFDLVRKDRRGRLKRFGEFWENFYTWGLIWTFNPGSLRRKKLFRMERAQVWISRQAFLERYGR
ncbi:MAG: hypothetical protein ACE5I2_06790 [Anaerolineae bacterium]